MPSSSHEIIREAIASRPELLLDLLAKSLSDESDGPLSGFEWGQSRLLPAPAEAVSLTTREHRADLVFLVGDSEVNTQRVLVVEIQLGMDEDKHFTWPHYVTTFRLRHRCPCDLVVVTPHDKVAEWANLRVELGVRNAFRPVVIGPRSLPLITDAAQAMECLELSMVSVLAHGLSEKGDEVGRAALLALHASRAQGSVDEDRWVLYYDVIRKALPEAVRSRLEEQMNLKGIEFESDFAKHHFHEGREEGRKEGRVEGREEGREEGRAQATREKLVRVLSARNLPPTESQRSRIFSCQDLDTLDRWFDRALEIADVEELFD